MDINIDQEMWEQIRTIVKIPIPPCIVRILTLCGYTTIESLENLSQNTESETQGETENLEQTFKDIEDSIQNVFLQEIKKFNCPDSSCSCKLYKTENQEPGQAHNAFRLLPSHRVLIIAISNKIREYYAQDHAPEEQSTSPVPAQSHTTFTGTKAGTPVLRALIDSANFNREGAPKKGYLYSPLIRKFSTFLFLLSGRRCYNFLQKNLSIPTYSSVCKYLYAEDKISEGRLRCSELSEYLERENVAKKVWLSEDATAVTSKLKYDPKTNLIVGLVLPLNSKGCPVTSSYFATDEKTIMNLLKENERSSQAYVVMAQPLDEKVAPFLLQLFGTNSKFKGSDIFNRWKFIKDELEICGIEVVGVSTDGDPRCLSAMKKIMFDAENYSAHQDTDTQMQAQVHTNINTQSKKQRFLVTQDTLHLGNKLRNRLLNAQTLTMGAYTVSSKHLETIVKNWNKSEHLLSKIDIYPTDKMNTESFEKLIKDCVINVLKQLDNTAGTIQFLKMCKDVTSCYLDPKIPPLERIQRMSRGCHFLRIWRESLKTAKQIQRNFITPNAYCCVEINFSNLISMIKKFRDENIHENFLPTLFDSQTCERTFSIFRSMGTMQYTKTDFCIYDMLQLQRRIDIMNKLDVDLKSRGVSTLNKRREKMSFHELPSDEQINEAIKYGKLEAINDAKSVGINLSEKSLVTIGEYKFDKDMNFDHDFDSATLDESDDTDSLFPSQIGDNSEDDDSETSAVEDTRGNEFWKSLDIRLEGATWGAKKGQGVGSRQSAHSSMEIDDDPNDDPEGLHESSLEFMPEPDPQPHDDLEQALNLETDTINVNSPYVLVETDINESDPEYVEGINITKKVLMRKSTLIWILEDQTEKPGASKRWERYKKCYKRKNTEDLAGDVAESTSDSASKKTKQ